MTTAMPARTEPLHPRAGGDGDAALGALLTLLGQAGYVFVTPTPKTHTTVLERRRTDHAQDLRDLFGWSLPFRPELLDPLLLDRLLRAGWVVPSADGLLRSKVRVSSLAGHLFVHSAFPTDEKNAVFFGPDTYRFASLIEDEMRQLGRRQIGTIVDIGTGSGVGAIVAARFSPDARLIGTDVNPLALRFAAVNARAAGLRLDCRESETLKPIEAPIDIALANPPYMIDDKDREYRDGGAMGIEVAVNMAREALGKLSANGKLILYTGTPILAGRDPLHQELAAVASDAGCLMAYREIDPDVFGEELCKEAYRDAERIAVIGAVFERENPA
jgi:methylase of polypeptide subunit release factors